MTIACFIAEVMFDFYKCSIARKRARECYDTTRRGQNWRTLWHGKIDVTVHAPPARAESRGKAMRRGDR